MILEDARPYAARAFGDEALQFVWLSLKDTAGRVAQNCVDALAEEWREERMKRELFALNDHLLKDIGLSRSEIGKAAGMLAILPGGRLPRSFHLEPRPGALGHHRRLTEKFQWRTIDLIGSFFSSPGPLPER